MAFKKSFTALEILIWLYNKNVLLSNCKVKTLKLNTSTTGYHSLRSNFNRPKYEIVPNGNRVAIPIKESKIQYFQYKYLIRRDIGTNENYFKINLKSTDWLEMLEAASIIQ